MVDATSTRRRARDDVVRLTHRGLSLEEYASQATTAVRRAVPADGVCLLTLDPATLLPTGEFVEDGLPAAVMPRLGQIEQREQDVNKFVTLARQPIPAASLSEATEGDLERSLRQREVRGPSGFGDELRVALGDGTGTWGALTLLRVSDRPNFARGDVTFLASLAGILADGVRRALLATPPVDDPHPGPGFLVLAPDGTMETSNRDADHWLGVLGVDSVSALPPAVLAVADRARSGDGRLATARVRSRYGPWILVRGSLLGDGSDERVAIHLEAARAPELAPLVAASWGLTERERQVTDLVARGHTTSEIAALLEVSAYTVQDHVKAIFEKSGTGSRGELVARLFLDHRMPKLSS